MSEVRIIQLPPEQWPRYRELRLESLREEPQAFGSSFEDMEQRPEAFWQGRLSDAMQGEKSWLLFAQHGHQKLGVEEQDRDENIKTYSAPDP